MNSLHDQPTYGPQKLGASTRALPGGRTLLRPIRLHDVDEPDAPISARAVERLRNLPDVNPTAPPADMFDALKAVESMLYEAHRDRDRKRRVFDSTSISDPRRTVRKESWLAAQGYAEGVRSVQRVLMGLPL